MEEPINIPPNKIEVAPPRAIYSFSRNELRTIVGNNGGVLHDVDLEGVTDGMAIGGGWTVKIFAEKQIGAKKVGSVVLNSSHRELRDLIKQGRIKSLLEMGFTPHHAEIIFKLDIKHKYTLAPKLAEIINYEPLREAFLAYPEAENPEERKIKYEEWRIKYSKILNLRRSGASFVDEQNLAKTVKAIVSEDTKNMSN